MAEDEAEAAEAEVTSEGVTSGVDLPATMMIALHHATTKIAGLLLGIMMTAMAAVAAAEGEADITRRDPMTEEALWTAMLAVGLKGTTVLGTPTGMIGMVAPAMGQDGLAPPAHSTGIPGHGGITEAEAGAMRGRQDL